MANKFWGSPIKAYQLKPRLLSRVTYIRFIYRRITYISTGNISTCLSRFRISFMEIILSLSKNLFASGNSFQLLRISVTLPYEWE